MNKTNKFENRRREGSKGLSGFCLLVVVGVGRTVEDWDRQSRVFFKGFQVFLGVF